MSNDLLAITYSEFDNHVGPQLKYSYPPDILTKDSFEAISDYVILGKHLCDRLMSVVLDKFQLLCYSVAIENGKYERNCLTFAFGFVLTPSADTDAYGKTLRKLVSSFVDLEMENEYLFQMKTKAQVPELLKAIFMQLKGQHASFLPILCPNSNSNQATNSAPSSSAGGGGGGGGHHGSGGGVANSSTASSAANHHHVPLQHSTSFVSSTGTTSRDNAHLALSRNTSSNVNNTANPPTNSTAATPAASNDHSYVSTSHIYNTPGQMHYHYLVTQLFQTPSFPLPNARAINDYDVPIFRSDKISFAHLPWDISFQHIVMYIDGTSHVKKIVKEANMDAEFVKKSLGLLVFHGAIVMSDIFKFSNVYKLQDDDGYCQAFNNVTDQPSMSTYNNALSLLANQDLLIEIRDFACMEFIFNSALSHGKSVDTKELLPSYIDIARFLLQLQPNKSVAQILLDSYPTSNIPPQESKNEHHGHSRRPSRSRTNSHSQYAHEQSFDGDNMYDFEPNTAGSATSNVEPAEICDWLQKLKNADLARIVAYAQMKGIIRRMHEYPVYIPVKPSDANSSSTPNPFTTMESPKDANRNAAPGTSPIAHSLLSDNIAAEESKAVNVTANEGDGGVDSNGKAFNRLKSKGTSVVGRAYLRDATESNTAANSKCAHHNNIADIVQQLDGTEHLDAICCKYDVNYHELVACPGVHIIYK